MESTKDQVTTVVTGRQRLVQSLDATEQIRLRALGLLKAEAKISEYLDTIINEGLELIPDQDELEDEELRIDKKLQVVTKEADLQIELYSTALLTPLCALIYTKLPRELRDLVYSHLVHKADTKLRVVRTYRYFNTDMQLAEDFEWDPKCVGAATRREMVQYWYAISKFKVEIDDYKLLDRLLEEDQWGLGLCPRDYITNIKIACAYANVASPEAREALTEKLGSLLRLGKKHVAIRFVFNPYWMLDDEELDTYADVSADDSFSALLEVVFPILQRLWHAGLDKLSLQCVVFVARTCVLTPQSGEFSMRDWLRRRAEDRKYLRLRFEE
ncbi:hypothetical protein BDV95DRAFT_608173 [Massariosphaeria phaeospora]|uniref:Uncharacterized protein n=1 Tax=Massariosphaeria phaeospora TaxID=100035 RepID=A0A7C8M4L2_9PLEO|nr:hypothetical protein BDV95DRAFT_608173 [Massariosphaeria phaeospora]